MDTALKLLFAAGLEAMMISIAALAARADTLSIVMYTIGLGLYLTFSTIKLTQKLNHKRRHHAESGDSPNRSLH